MTHRFLPKTLFIVTMTLFFGLVLVDHLTSPTLQSTGAPSDLGNACAPCGAPCT
jgi:hypothetical protein